MQPQPKNIPSYGLGLGHKFYIRLIDKVYRKCIKVKPPIIILEAIMATKKKLIPKFVAWITTSKGEKIYAKDYGKKCFVIWIESNN